ncbi:MAG TPA: hypothetical protein VK453_00120 [Micromonosporaceae bacterium]|nr:hypothetical protein [Micromonosporaceae bacterium]
MFRSPAAASAAAEPDPGDIAVSAGMAVRDPDGSVVFGPRPTSVFRQETTAPAASAPASGQTQAAPAVTVPVATPAVTPPAATADRAAPAQPDLAAMADELYERIERRLRTDLFLERERLGSLVDP